MRAVFTVAAIALLSCASAANLRANPALKFSIRLCKFDAVAGPVPIQHPGVSATAATCGPWALAAAGPASLNPAKLSVSEQVDRRYIAGPGFSVCYAPSDATTTGNSFIMQCTQVHSTADSLVPSLVPRFAPTLNAPAGPGKPVATPNDPLVTLPVMLLSSSGPSPSSTLSPTAD